MPISLEIYPLRNPSGEIHRTLYFHILKKEYHIGDNVDIGYSDDRQKYLLRDTLLCKFSVEKYTDTYELEEKEITLSQAMSWFLESNRIDLEFQMDDEHPYLIFGPSFSVTHYVRPEKQVITDPVTKKTKRTARTGDFQMAYYYPHIQEGKKIKRRKLGKICILADKTIGEHVNKKGKLIITLQKSEATNKKHISNIVVAKYIIYNQKLDEYWFLPENILDNLGTCDYSQNSPKILIDKDKLIKYVKMGATIIDKDINEDARTLLHQEKVKRLKNNQITYQQTKQIEDLQYELQKKQKHLIVLTYEIQTLEEKVTNQKEVITGLQNEKDSLQSTIKKQDIVLSKFKEENHKVYDLMSDVEKKIKVLEEEIKQRKALDDAELYDILGKKSQSNLTHRNRQQVWEIEQEKEKFEKMKEQWEIERANQENILQEMAMDNKFNKKLNDIIKKELSLKEIDIKQQLKEGEFRLLEKMTGLEKREIELTFKTGNLEYAKMKLELEEIRQVNQLKEQHLNLLTKEQGLKQGQLQLSLQLEQQKVIEQIWALKEKEMGMALQKEQLILKQEALDLQEERIEFNGQQILIKEEARKLNAEIKMIYTEIRKLERTLENPEYDIEYQTNMIKLLNAQKEMKLLERKLKEEGVTEYLKQQNLIQDIRAKKFRNDDNERAYHILHDVSASEGLIEERAKAKKRLERQRRFEAGKGE